jgi:hypothetical protein
VAQSGSCGVIDLDDGRSISKLLNQNPKHALALHLLQTSELRCAHRTENPKCTPLLFAKKCVMDAPFTRHRTCVMTLLDNNIDLVFHYRAPIIFADSSLGKRHPDDKVIAIQMTKSLPVCACMCAFISHRLVPQPKSHQLSLSHCTRHQIAFR